MLESRARGEWQPPVYDELDKNVPQEMKKAKQWCFYRTQPSVDGILKRVINPYDGKRAKCNEPRDWGDYDTAKAQSIKYKGEGIAYCLVKEQGITCVDLDKVIGEDGELSATAKDIYSRLTDTYVEKSVSGKGLHFFCKGNLAKLAGKKNEKTGVEMYDTTRFICMTGNSMNGVNTLKEYTGELEELNKQYIKASREEYIQEHRTPMQVSFGDSELIEKIRASRQGAKFDTLYGGGGSSDLSGGDIALCNVLAFWTRDADQIDRVFRSSARYGLLRKGELTPKWERRIGNTTYGDRTIAASLCYVKETLMSTAVKSQVEKYPGGAKVKAREDDELE